jgi:hypothetical protein
LLVSTIQRPHVDSGSPSPPGGVVPDELPVPPLELPLPLLDPLIDPLLDVLLDPLPEELPLEDPPGRPDPPSEPAPDPLAPSKVGELPVPPQPATRSKDRRSPLLRQKDAIMVFLHVRSCCVETDYQFMQ